MTGSPEGGIARLAWRLPGLARRSRRLAVTMAGGPSLQLTVRYQGRRYRAEISDPAPAGGGVARTGTSPVRRPVSVPV